MHTPCKIDLEKKPREENPNNEVTLIRHEDILGSRFPSGVRKNKPNKDSIPLLMNDRDVVYSTVSSGESHMYNVRCYNVNSKSKELKFYEFNRNGVLLVRFDQRLTRFLSFSRNQSRFLNRESVLKKFTRATCLVLSLFEGLTRISANLLAKIFDNTIDMGSMENIDDPCRRSSLSIFVEDVDSRKDVLNRDEKCDKEQRSFEERNEERSQDMSDFSLADSTEQQLELDNKTTTQASNEAIKQVMAEMERRKHEFCKLIDEHDALVKHLKAMEVKHSNFKMAQQSPIMI